MNNVSLRNTITNKVKFFNPYKPTAKECFSYFIQYLAYFSFLTPNDLKDVEQYWEYYLLHKNQPLVLPGDVCEYIVFICKGAIKHYVLHNNNPVNIDFATDGHFCSGIRSFLNQSKAGDGFVCTQNTFCLRISYKKFKELIQEHPAFATLFEMLNEESTLRLMNRLASFQTMDAKGRYLLLKNENPDVFHRFTVQDISNYLGIKPETLCRLRKSETAG